MADIIDEASEWEEELRQRALEKRKPNGPVATGRCLDSTCDEPLPNEQRWCDATCRDRYHRQVQVVLDGRGKYYDQTLPDDET